MAPQLRDSNGRFVKAASPTSATEPSATHSPLLKLPGELRNRIYRCAIVPPERIMLQGPDRLQPALLSPSRQGRGEAFSIYYSENVLNFVVRDMAGISMTPFRKLLLKYRKRQCTNFCMLMSRVVNWANLLMWLKAHYEDHRLAFWPLAIGDNQNSRMQIMNQAFAVVKNMRDQSWDKVVDVLEAFHKALAVLDAAWA